MSRECPEPRQGGGGGGECGGSSGGGGYGGGGGGGDAKGDSEGARKEDTPVAATAEYEGYKLREANELATGGYRGYHGPREQCLHCGGHSKPWKIQRHPLYEKQPAECLGFVPKWPDVCMHV